MPASALHRKRPLAVLGVGFVEVANCLVQELYASPALGLMIGTFECEHGVDRPKEGSCLAFDRWRFSRTSESSEAINISERGEFAGRRYLLTEVEV